MIYNKLFANLQIKKGTACPYLVAYNFFTGYNTQEAIEEHAQRILLLNLQRIREMTIQVRRKRGSFYEGFNNRVYYTIVLYDAEKTKIRGHIEV